MTSHLNPKQQDIFDRVCTSLTEGNSLEKSLNDIAPEMAVSTFYRWLNEDEKRGGSLREEYARAREDQAETLADRLIATAADPSIDHNRARLIVDAQKWVASKLKPKKYGDKIRHSGDDDGAPISVVLAKGDENL